MTDSANNSDKPPHPKTRHKTKRTRSRSNGKAKSQLNQLAAIEELLSALVSVIKDGKPTRVPTLEAMTLRLLQNSLTGDKKAERVRQQFEAFARRDTPPEVEVVFVDNDYTTAFGTKKEGHDV